MPELPEVEIVKRQLKNKIVGDKIVSGTCSVESMARPDSQTFFSRITAQTIKDVSRSGKYIVFTLERGFIIVHLKLNGRIFIRGADYKDDLYMYVVLRLSDGISKKEVRLTDSRKFAYMQYFKDKNDLEKVIGKLGIDPLTELTAENLYEIISSSKRKIKDVLMDQTLISGIGNIYANDILWQVGIHPQTQSNKISKTEAADLYKTIKEILTEAIKEGGSSKQWFLHTDGSKGTYQEHFKIYGKKGEKCPRHPDTKVEFIKVSQRGTFICRKCQKKK